MLHSIVIDNGIHGAAESFRDTPLVRHTFVRTGPGFAPDLSAADLLIAPNGTDHIALLRIKDDIRAFIQRGGILFCFCGWFTDWIPGHRWTHDNSKASRDIRLSLGVDRHNLFAGVSLDKFNSHHDITGWWACGFIEPAPGSDVILHDTWRRPIIVLDETHAPGFLLLTASGPLGDYAPDSAVDDGLARLYHNAIALAHSRKNPPTSTHH